MTTINKPMTGEQLDELMTVSVNMQRESEKLGDRSAAMFAYAVQVAVLELRSVRKELEQLAAERAGLKKAEPAPFSKLMMEALDIYQAGADEVPELAMLSAYKKLRDGLKTPATDAILAEVRASGVDAFASALEARGKHHGYVEIAKAYAAQLRKGVKP